MLSRCYKWCFPSVGVYMMFFVRNTSGLRRTPWSFQLFCFPCWTSIQRSAPQLLNALIIHGLKTLLRVQCLDYPLLVDAVQLTNSAKDGTRRGRIRCSFYLWPIFLRWWSYVRSNCEVVQWRGVLIVCNRDIENLLKNSNIKDLFLLNVPDNNRSIKELTV